LYKAFRKYGIENFTFEIVEEVKNRKNITDREYFYYEKSNHLYNQTKPGMPIWNLSSKTVYQIDIDTGKIVKEYSSPAQATRAVGVSVYEALSGGRIKTAGHHWCYADNYDDWCKPQKESKRHGHSKKIKQIDVKTKKVINVFSSIKEATELLKLNRSAISQNLNGRSKSAGGFI
jgi:hypothetical protein